MLKIIGLVLLLGSMASILSLLFFFIRMVMGTRREYRYLTWPMGPFALLFSWPWTVDGNVARKKMFLALLLSLALTTSTVVFMDFFGFK